MKYTYECIHVGRAAQLKTLAKARGGIAKQMPIKHEPSFCNLTVTFDTGIFSADAPRMRAFQNIAREIR